MLGEFRRAYRHGYQVSQVMQMPPRIRRWGFCSIRGWLSACRRRVVVLMTPFPPFGGGDVAVRGGVVPTVQTTSAKTGENQVMCPGYCGECLVWSGFVDRVF